MVLISLLIIVFSLSGCTIGRLDEIPPRAFDEEYIKNSSEKGAEIGSLTADYIKDVLEVLGWEFKSGSEIAEDIHEILPTEGEIHQAVDNISEKIPSVGDIEKELDKVLPSQGEITEKVEEVSEGVDKRLKESVEAFGESIN